MTNKIYYACMIAMLAISIITGGCSKNDNNNPQEPAKVQKYHMVVSADKAQDHPANTPRRVLGLDGTTVNASWAVGEEVTVYNVTKNTAVSGVLTAQSNGARTTLSGDLTGIIEPSDILTLKFLSPDYTGQDGTLEYISAHCDYAEASVTVASVSGGNITSAADAVFENKQAIVKFTLISKADGTTLLNPSSFTINDGTNDIVTLTDIPAATYTANGNGVLFVSIPGFADKTITLTASNESDVYVCTKDHVTFANGSYYPITTKMTEKIHNGALPGEFSVSPTKKVRFSRGNLQYNAALGTHQCADGKTLQGTWRFAEHQWDYVGSANANIFSSYSGWIDLFGYGTSGWNSGVSCYSPYDYNEIENAYIDKDLMDSYANADWGIYNAISNGGNEPNLWRTLMGIEWTYLLSQRVNADKLYSSGTVNSITGLILLPDIWKLPNGVTFTPQGSSYSSNTYNASQWEQMENAGAIFLPAAGWRRGNEHLIILSGSGSGHRGCYHASTTYTESSHKYNHMVVFYSDELPFIAGNLRYMGLSVRLVSDVVE